MIIYIYIYNDWKNANNQSFSIKRVLKTYDRVGIKLSGDCVKHMNLKVMDLQYYNFNIL